VSSTEYGSLILDVLVGVGVLLIGVGIFIAGLALARALARLAVTLDALDHQLENVGAPATSTLGHVNDVAKSLGDTAASVSQTVDLTKSALLPAIVNFGAAVGGLSAGLRRFVTGKDRNNKE
jgi:hypothetical protein